MMRSTVSVKQAMEARVVRRVASKLRVTVKLKLTLNSNREYHIRGMHLCSVEHNKNKAGEGALVVS